MELGIRLSFVKTSEFRGGGGGVFEHQPHLGTPLKKFAKCFIMYGEPICL
jgi:hypothetical protein